MRDAISDNGDETTLAEELNVDDQWLSHDAGGRPVNVRQRSAQLALTEFNTGTWLAWLGKQRPKERRNARYIGQRPSR